jgi:hypothetical protein
VATTTAVLLPLVGAIALPGTASAVTGGSTLMVNNRTPFCSDTSTTAGSSATPFCTIQAAADAVGPGDTVEIFAGAANAVAYANNLTIASAGTAAAPITFEAVGDYIRLVDTNGNGTTLTVNGASHVNLVGFGVTNIDVENSSNVEVSHSQASNLSIGTGSSAVSAERNDLASVTVGSGAANTVIAANIVQTELLTGGITVSGATGTDITNNTFELQNDKTSKVSGIAVTDSSSGTSIENNVLWGNSEGVPELSVDASSTAGTSEKYNVLTLDGSTNVPYAWGGTDYSTLAAFQAASGQGTADLLGDFDTSTSDDLLTSENPAVASADSAAPGLPGTDFYGNAWTDDSAVPSTGTGPENYYDRGAVDFEGYTGATVNAVVDQQSVLANVDLSGLPMGGSATVDLAWGDGSTVQLLGPNSAQNIFADFSQNVGMHQYASAGTYTITATVTDDSGTRTFTTQVTTGGSTYVPVTPARVLDTRKPIGVPVAGAVAGGHSVAFSVTNGVAGAPTGSTISAVVLNVTATQPTAGGYVTAYPDGTAVPKSSNVNFTANETVPNLTTVMVGQDGEVDLYTSVTSQLVADVEGYYIASPAGSGYVPIAPARLLDTRKGIGAPTQAVAPGQTLSLQVSGAGGIPASGVVAAAMNVTVTGSSGDGVITVFPKGGTTPIASVVNYSTGETVANMAVAELGTGGQVEFTNLSGGTVQLIADVSGYYTSTGGDAFVPMAPWRALDTRNGTGQESSQANPAQPDANAVWFFADEFDGTGYWTGDSQAAAVVANVTVTQPTADGIMIAYPGPDLPATSNANFSAGQTLPSMVMVGTAGSGAPLLYNKSTGSTQMVADVFGYFS